MDMNDVFYFVSTRSYAKTYSTIYSGNFSNGNVSNIAIVPGISKDTPGDVNFRSVHQSGRQHALF
jgi:hypothetical protein